jgi:integrase
VGVLQRGLVLQVQPSGHRSYKLIYRHHARPRWYHIGAADAIALADARKLAAGIMLQVLQGVDPQAARKAQRGTDTFEELAARYCAEYAQKKNKSWRQADRLVTRYLLPRWGKLRAADITRGDVKATIVQIKGPIAANQVLASASAIFSWAIREEQGGIHVNPCSRVEGNSTKSRERVLSDSEIPNFWEAFNNAGLPGVGLKVLLLTGQRPGEVAHMRFDHIVDGWWTMPGAPDAATKWPGTKNTQTHRIWLPKAVQEILTALGNDNTGFVFGGVLSLDATMRDVCRQLGAPRATPHDLRRTHGTMITALGFGRDAMNRIQNHREGGISSVYDRHQYAEENKRIMEAVTTKIITLAQKISVLSNVVPLHF